MVTKEIRKINLRIRILANAIAEQQKNGQINPYLMKDIEHIILDESLEQELK